MNAYQEQRLAADAVLGMKAVKRYCEYRKGKCHVDGLPDCRFNVGGALPWCRIMSFQKKPMFWSSEKVDK